jgi:hypothetical protein
MLEQRLISTDQEVHKQACMVHLRMHAMHSATHPVQELRSYLCLLPTCCRSSGCTPKRPGTQAAGH